MYTAAGPQQQLQLQQNQSNMRCSKQQQQACMQKQDTPSDTPPNLHPTNKSPRCCITYTHKNASQVRCVLRAKEQSKAKGLGTQEAMFAPIGPVTSGGFEC